MGLDDFRIIDSTLREGEQFAGAFFTSQQKLDLARRLDDFGVEYLEVTSPAASPQSRQDCERIAGLGLSAKVLAHTRCHPEDVRLAVECGVAGVNLLFGTSRWLREHSHGRSIAEIAEAGAELVRRLRQQGVEVRFSAEDAFRSDLVDLLTVYRAVAEAGADRIGVADTVGVATPTEVSDLVRTLRRTVAAEIEFHGHNDTGCAVANAFSALEAGAGFIDTSILGIGERNGITPLSGLIARLYARCPEELRRRYDLRLLPRLDATVAAMLQIEIPFNSAITGPTAFSHRAGLHTKAVLSDPTTYEILDPQDFGRERTLELAHRLTGWNAMKHRAVELRLSLSDDEIRRATGLLKALADERPLLQSDVDALLHRTAEESLGAGGGRP